MRRTIVAFLVFILAVNLFGNFISFIAERQAIRQEREHLSISETEQFEFTPEGFQQLDTRDGGKEFFLNGEMFDILKIKFLPGKVLILAYNDAEETNLLEKFLSLFDSETSSAAKHSNKTFSFSLSEFIGVNSGISIFTMVRVFSLAATQSKLLISFLAVQSPPPDLS